jgi:hypothetical protein
MAAGIATITGITGITGAEVFSRLHKGVDDAFFITWRCPLHPACCAKPGRTGADKRLT